MVSKLSGGEKKRLQLMRVLMGSPNFLILDEPSNDLDIDTLNVLEEFLENYPGVLVMVSHDRYLIDKLTDQLFIFEGEGNIRIYNGNYADYKSEQENALKEKRSKKKTNTINTPAPVSVTTKKTLSYKEQIEYEALENEIQQLEETLETKANKLNTLSDHTEIMTIAKEIEDIKITLDQKSERWMELAENI